MKKAKEIEELRAAIHGFIRQRLEEKLKNVKEAEEERRARLVEQFEPEVWLADAARRVAQIQLATHTLKPLHPDARGTNLHSTPESPSGPLLVGTHSLGEDRPNDVVGNAAALDVFKFLNVRVEGRSLLEWALSRDESFVAALSEDDDCARQWCEAFASLPQSKATATSHTLGKQLYFPLQDGSYHLLAPLFPTTLVHRVHMEMREQRFGERAKEARKAQKEKRTHPCGFREYPDMAIRKFGGSKPQNISQLNSERYGENWLLASAPPVWKSSDTVVPLHVHSVFDTTYGRQRRVRALTRRLRQFLERVGHNNLHIRQHRASLVQEICDEAVAYAGRLRALPPGWSAKSECRLHEAEKLWLDPERAIHDAEFRARRADTKWPSEVSHRFANWLNAALSSKKFSLGDAEHNEWKGVLAGELNMFKSILEDDRADA